MMMLMLRNSYGGHCSTTWMAFLFGLQFLFRINLSYGQEIVVGVDVCACQPTVYELTFDLSMSCSDNTINNTELLPGINDTNCIQFSGPGNSETLGDRLIPITISDITVEESNLQFIIIARQLYNGTFRSGDSIQYTSSIVNISDTDTDTDTDIDNIPHALTVTMNGNTSLGFTVVNTWVIVFDNDCQTYPVLYDGLTIGWTRLSVISEPDSNLCPAVDNPTENNNTFPPTPSLSSSSTTNGNSSDIPTPSTTTTDNTAIPTSLLSDINTLSPTSSRGDIVTNPPTESVATTTMPTSLLSDIITLAPTSLLSDITTSSPTSLVSDIITVTPTSMLSDIITAAPTSLLSDIITASPTSLLSDINTASPTSLLSEFITVAPSSLLSDIITASPTSLLSDIITVSPTSLVSDIITAAPTSLLSDITTLSPTSSRGDIVTNSPAESSVTSTTIPTSSLSDIVTASPTSLLSDISTSQDNTESPTTTGTRLLTVVSTSTPTTGSTTVLPTTSAPTATPTTGLTTIAPTSFRGDIVTNAPTASITSTPILLPTASLPISRPISSPVAKPSTKTLPPACLPAITATYLPTSYGNIVADDDTYVGNKKGMSGMNKNSMSGGGKGKGGEKRTLKNIRRTVRSSTSNQEYQHGRILRVATRPTMLPTPSNGNNVECPEL